MKMKSFKIKGKETKKRGFPIPETKAMKSKKTYSRKVKHKNEEEDMDESTSIRSLLSKFVTNIFEKKYAEANNMLAFVINEKMKNKIKTEIENKKECDCGCDDCKKNKKKLSKGN